VGTAASVGVVTTIRGALAGAPGNETASDVRTSMASNFNPGQFVREVRQETAKVTWPTRRETTITTIMVFIFVFLAALFFFVVDQILSVGVRALLGLGG
jgi:preprotein translocase subunit SecE